MHNMADISTVPTRSNSSLTVKGLNLVFPGVSKGSTLKPLLFSSMLTIGRVRFNNKSALFTSIQVKNGSCNKVNISYFQK